MIISHSQPAILLRFHPKLEQIDGLATQVNRRLGLYVNGLHWDNSITFMHAMNIHNCASVYYTFSVAWATILSRSCRLDCLLSSTTTWNWCNYSTHVKWTFFQSAIVWFCTVWTNNLCVRFGVAVSSACSPSGVVHCSVLLFCCFIILGTHFAWPWTLPCCHSVLRGTSCPSHRHIWSSWRHYKLDCSGNALLQANSKMWLVSVTYVRTLVTVMYLHTYIHDSDQLYGRWSNCHYYYWMSARVHTYIHTRCNLGVSIPVSATLCLFPSSMIPCVALLAQ